jgi:hypothetical protein
VPCREHLAQLRQQYRQVKALGGEVIAVSFEPPERVTQLADQMQLPFLVLSDPERKTYDAYRLGSGSWLRIFSPGTVWTYLKHFAVGGKYDQRYSRKSSDWKQLGGDFILDANGSVTFEHHSTAPSDRPQVSQLVRMLGDV